MKINSIVKDRKIWYEIYNAQDEFVIATKSYKRAIELIEIISKNKDIEIIFKKIIN